MLSQPELEISGTAEIQQRIGECLQTLLRQGLNTGDGGLAQVPATAAKLSEGDCSSLRGAATSFALLAAFFNPILGETGVAAGSDRWRRGFRVWAAPAASAG